MTLLIGAVLSAGGIQQRPTFSSVTSAVRLDVSVFDGAKTVHGLEAKNFEVLDSDVRQEFTIIETRDAPLDVVVVVQPSESVAGRRSKLIEQTVQSLVSLLGTGDVLAGIVASASPQLVRKPLPLTGLAVFPPATGSGVALRDAMLQALSLLPESDRRKAVLVFTDGQHDQSWTTASGLRAAADQRSMQIIVGAVDFAWAEQIHTFVYDYPYIKEDRIRYGVEGNLEIPQWLIEVARRTGGGVLDLREDRRVERLAKLISDLRAQYVITYTPAGVPAAGWHPVKVRLKGRKGVVVTRSGYWIH